MTSLKQYSKKLILTENSKRFTKIASMLDDEDYEDMLQQSLSWLDEAIFTPREVIVKPDQMIEYNGGTFVDVTAMKIDVINHVYFQDTFSDQLNTILPEVGLMPFILGGSTFTSLGSVADYLALRGNLNSLNRQLDLDGDYELWPKDADGRQLLQLRNKMLTRLEFLPSIDRDAEEWYLYDFEYSALKDLLFAMCNKFNAQMQFSAVSLGVGKDAQALLTYWDNEIEKIKKEFHDKSLVTYLE